MRTSDGGRIDQVLVMARDRLALEDLSSGPGVALGFGLEYAAHSALGFILQDLGRFPGKGWDFIAAGLRSPVIRNRNMAILALSEWGWEH